MIKIISKLFKKKPDKVYVIRADLQPDMSEIDAVLAKVEELEAEIKRARTLAGELARAARSIKVDVKANLCTAEPADITADHDCDF